MSFKHSAELNKVDTKAYILQFYFYKVIEETRTVRCGQQEPTRKIHFLQQPVLRMSVGFYVKHKAQLTNAFACVTFIY